MVDWKKEKAGMDFELNNEQIDIQKAAAEFAAGEFDPDEALEYDSRQEFPEKLRKKACELGFVGLNIPEEYEGSGFGILENVLVTEAFCRRESGIGMALALCDFGSEMILRAGNDDQKRKVLPAVVQGKALTTMAFLENGYSLDHLETTAQLQNDGYLIRGRKNFVTLGDRADFLIVVCQSEGGTQATEIVLLLEGNRQGMEAVGAGKKVGMRMIPVASLFFSGAAVPPADRIGSAQSGYSQLREVLPAMRVEAGAMGTGIAQGALDRAMDYAKKREQFGRPIVSFEAIKNKLANMAAEVESARLITYKAASFLDAGKADVRLSLLSKMTAAGAACRAADDALQIHGGSGYMSESHIERFYRDAKVLDLFLEPERIQRNMLADEIISKSG